MFRKTILAAALSLAALPAAAGGQVSLGIQARTADEAAALRAGLVLYTLHRDIKTNGHVTQQGINHAAGLFQTGPGHRGLIVQNGRDHTGSLTQTGAGHSFGLFQSGRGTTAHVVQQGRGAAGLLFVHGW